MNENELAQKFERDLQDTLGGKNFEHTADLSQVEKERLDLARRLTQVVFSRKSMQQANLRARLFEMVAL